MAIIGVRREEQCCRTGFSSACKHYKLAVLSTEEMRELFGRVKEGDAGARDALVRGNLRLVLSILQRFKNRGEPLDDLFQVGCIGLLKAIDNFQLEQGVNFSTYAVPMIIGEIKRYLRDNNSIHISRSIKSLSHRVLQTREKLLKESHREPKLSEIAAAMEMTVEEVVFAFNAALEPLSLYDPSFMTAPIRSMSWIDQRSVRQHGKNGWRISPSGGAGKLEPREKQIIEARFFEERPGGDSAKWVSPRPRFHGSKRRRWR